MLTGAAPPADMDESEIPSLPLGLVTTTSCKTRSESYYHGLRGVGLVLVGELFLLAQTTATNVKDDTGQRIG